MCIYYRDSTDLKYSSEEHIFPQALGGRIALPVGYVSDKFNNEISKLEQELLRDSIVGTMRQFVGPGKKGSLSKNKATKSKIHIITEDGDSTSISLGYIQQELTVEIPQARIDLISGSVTFSFSANIYKDYSSEVKKFRSLTDTPEKLIIKTIRTDALDKSAIIFAIQEKVEENFNAFLAINKESEFIMDVEFIKQIGKKIPFNGQMCVETGDLHFQHKTFIDPSHLRIFTKIAFNFLAYAMGQNFIINEQFDKVRNWIVTGDEPPCANYVSDCTKPFGLNLINFPEDAHYVFITKREDILIAKVVLYNKFAALIQLSTSFTESFDDISLICDWRIRKEYSIIELIQSNILGYWPN